MVTVKDIHDQARYTGHTAGSIVRRVWGRAAKLNFSPDQNNRNAGMVVRTDRYGTHVLANVVVWED